MNRLYQANCCLFDCLLAFQSDELLARYGDEIRGVFRDELSDAWHEGPSAILRVWSGILAETIALTTPRYAARLRLLLAASVLASGLTVGTVLGFCTIGPSPVVHACSQEGSNLQSSPPTGTSGDLIQLPDRHKMFLECSGDSNAGLTVILATGRGLGTADSWALVQQKVPPSIRTCSYDAIGAGRSDHVQESPQSRPIDQVVSEMHGLFQAARLKQPYVLVGASAGGILVRRYQQEYTHEVAGLIFVDSSHEEMEWRDAAISTQIDPNWNNPVFLRENGFLPDHQKLTWHADIPLIDLERSEKAPFAAFPGLTQQQVDAINSEWHNFQVDLAGRSKYGEYRLVADSGHMMHRQKPEAIADAIRDIVKQVRSESH
ncbi:MAG TPA: alpha/beta hydrolase [Edaphobacter sp.]|nr:alpha/beta hydrolase [Edaphobacter sp.]